MNTLYMHRRAIAGALVASLALLGAACSDDDEDAAETGDTPAAEETTTTAAPDEDAPEGDEEGGAPDVNPCAEGESGIVYTRTGRRFSRIACRKSAQSSLMFCPSG